MKPTNNNENLEFKPIFQINNDDDMYHVEQEQDFFMQENDLDDLALQEEYSRPEYHFKNLIENCNDIKILENNLKDAKELSPYYHLQDWQMEILNTKTTQKSFCRFNDRNNITRGLALRFFKKDAQDLDQISNFCFDETITPEQIADFMVDVANNPAIIYKTNEIYNELKAKISKLKKEIKHTDKKKLLIKKNNIMNTQKTDLSKNIKINVVDYSEKAIAITGDTKEIKDLLKNLNFRYNKFLKCGAGWITSKPNFDKVKNELKQFIN